MRDSAGIAPDFAGLAAALGQKPRTAQTLQARQLAVKNDQMISYQVAGQSVRWSVMSCTDPAGVGGTVPGCKSAAIAERILGQIARAHPRLRVLADRNLSGVIPGRGGRVLAAASRSLRLTTGGWLYGLTHLAIGPGPGVTPQPRGAVNAHPRRQVTSRRWRVCAARG